MTQRQSKQFVLKRIDTAVQDYVRKLMHFVRHHSNTFSADLEGIEPMPEAKGIVYRLDRHFPG